MQSTSKAVRYIWLTLLLLVLLPGIFISCTSSRQQSEISLSDTKPVVKSSTANQQPLGVAVAGVLSPMATLSKYQGMADYLGARLGRPSRLLLRPTYAEINDLVRTGLASVAFVCDGAYVEGQRQFGMELLVAPQIDGQIVYYSYIIVPYESAAISLVDLKDKTFAFSDPLSTTGRLAPSHALAQQGTTPEAFFRQYFFTYSHENSIRAVAGRLMDGAAVDSLVYDELARTEPETTSRTRVVERLGPYGIPPVVVSPSLDNETKERLRLAFLEAHEDEQGRQALRTLGVDRFVVLPDSAYDSVRKMAEKVWWSR